ncbi:acylphosphatase [Sodalis sp. dw_96]|uniref:acylphosphatase n=1 Tax=Sodalis sp. dw_96 TaxID=2719794 RepID=UPI001BD30F9C|nr:acylphosphatase [Sodalis sp. dw_96]
MSKVCTSIYIYGVVQGVGFRYHAQHRAQELGLVGYVRNLEDGGVEVVACGDGKQLDKFQDWLKQGGPRSARIEKILSEPKSVDEFEFNGFQVRY